MSYEVRWQLLKDNGFTTNDFYKAVANCRKINRNRKVSNDFARIHNVTCYARSKLDIGVKGLRKLVLPRMKKKSTDI